MQCPQCGHSTLLVLDTRPSEQLIRRRRCTNCEHKFTTLDIPAPSTLQDILGMLLASIRAGPSANQPPVMACRTQIASAKSDGLGDEVQKTTQRRPGTTRAISTREVAWQ